MNIVCASADELSSNFFEDALRVLTAGGSITITLPTGNSSVKRNLMFSGFTSVSVSTEGDLQKLSAIKPEFDVGAAAAVKLNPAIVATENNWNFDMDDGQEVRIIFIIYYFNELYPTNIFLNYILRNHRQLTLLFSFFLFSSFKTD